MSIFFGNPYSSQTRGIPVYHGGNNHPFFYQQQQQQQPQRGGYYTNGYGYDNEDDDDDEEEEQFTGYQRQHFNPFVANLSQKRPAYDREAALLELQRKQRRLQEQQMQVERERQRIEQERLLELKRRQQLMELQRKKQKQEQEQAMREAILLRKRALFLRYTHAAKVVQRAFRVHLSKKHALQAKQLEQKREKSAFIVQRTLKNFKLQQEAKRVVKKLRLLAEIRNQVESFRSQYEEKVLSKPVYDGNAVTPNKDYLVYEDVLLKALIKLDGVLSEGFEIVRDTRKAVITKTQKLLGRIDEHKTYVAPMEVEINENEMNENEINTEILEPKTEQKDNTNIITESIEIETENHNLENQEIEQKENIEIVEKQSEHEEEWVDLKEDAKEEVHMDQN